MTHRNRFWRLLAVVFAFTLIAAACGDDDDDAGDDTVDDDTTGDDDAGDDDADDDDADDDDADDDDTEGLTEVSLQLQWVPQAQFAGYYAAAELGFYEDVGLDVEVLEGGLDIVPATVLSSGGADFAVSWVPRGLAPREEGLDLTHIAQVFQRSGTLQVSLADSGIATVDDLSGTNVGNWGGGNEAELFAGLRSAGIDPDADVTLVQQDFNMTALLNGDIDAAQAMIYNEYAQVLETENPDTGELYQPSDLNIIDWNEVGTAMLNDALWADESRLADDDEYRATAVKFVEASLRGWVHCRDNAQECVDIVVAVGTPFGGPGHQAWMMNEINALIWPSPGKIGILDPADRDQTIEIALAGAILAAEPDEGAFRTDIAEEAVANLEAAGVDVIGADFEKGDVEVTPGGE